jgi:hypothetical protein
MLALSAFIGKKIAKKIDKPQKWEYIPNHGNEANDSFF